MVLATGTDTTKSGTTNIEKGGITLEDFKAYTTVFNGDKQIISFWWISIGV